MDATGPLRYVAVGFEVFAAILLVVPVVLVFNGTRSWHDVWGLWVAGWGFLLMGVGTQFASRGWGDLVVFGVLVTAAGQLIQRRAAKRPGSK